MNEWVQFVGGASFKDISVISDLWYLILHVISDHKTLPNSIDSCATVASGTTATIDGVR